MFVSRRERSLWLWTAAAIAGVYASLGLSSILTEVFYSQGAAAAVLLAAMALIGVVVVTQGLRVPPGRVEIGIGLGIGVVYSMLFFRMTMPERSHLIEYGVVAVLFYEALREGAVGGRRVPQPWLLAIVATTLVGMVDETIQIALPDRVFDPVDMVFNFLAALTTVAAMSAVSWGGGVAARWLQIRRNRPSN